jgi:hypothetical protein
MSKKPLLIPVVASFLLSSCVVADDIAYAIKRGEGASSQSKAASPPQPLNPPPVATVAPEPPPPVPAPPRNAVTIEDLPAGR